jgi:hypothetical protein
MGKLRHSRSPFADVLRPCPATCASVTLVAKEVALSAEDTEYPLRIAQVVSGPHSPLRAVSASRRTSSLTADQRPRIAKKSPRKRGRFRQLAASSATRTLPPSWAHACPVAFSPRDWHAMVFSLAELRAAPRQAEHALAIPRCARDLPKSHPSSRYPWFPKRGVALAQLLSRRRSQTITR